MVIRDVQGHSKLELLETRRNKAIGNTMFCRAKSSPAGGSKGGTIGLPFSKNSIGDRIGSNFEGAHHLSTNQSK